MDEDEKHKVLTELDKQAEGEESEEVADVDEKLKDIGLVPDPENNINILDAANQLDKNAKKD